MSQQIQYPTHKAFQLMPIVEKLPLHIECLTCFNSTLIVGTGSGQLLVYIINLNQKNALEVSLERTIKSITKKPIQQLEAIHKYSILIALFESQIHVFDLTTYQFKYTLQKTKGAYSFTVTINPQIINLCVVCKRKLQFYYLKNTVKNSQFMDLVNDLELNDTPKTIEFLKDNQVIFSLRKDYYLYELPSPSSSSSNTSNLTETSSTNSSSQIKELFNIGGSQVSLKSMEPLVYKVKNYEFNKISIALFPEDRKTVLLDENLKPKLEYQINWSSNPANICSVGPYLVSLLPGTNSVEVLTIEPKSLNVQTIEFQSLNSAGLPTEKLDREKSTSSASSSLASSFQSTSQFLANMAPQIVQTVASTGILGSAASTAITVNNSERLKLLATNGNSVFYIATQSNIWCLLLIEINEQLNSLIKYRNYDLAIGLHDCYKFYQQLNADVLLNKTSVIENQLQLFLNLNIFQASVDENLIIKAKHQNALELFCQKQFEPSMKQFESLNTDPSYIIAFIRGLLPESHRAQLIQYKDFKLPDLNIQETKTAIDFLIDYLQFKRKEILKDDKNLVLSLYSLVDYNFISKSRKATLEIIDTTLLQAYLRIHEQLVTPLLRRENTYFHLETCERLLKQQGKLNELLILYEKRNLHERALDLLNEELGKQNSKLNNIDHVIRYLKKLTNKYLELIFKYSKSIIERNDYDIGLQIFVTNTELLERKNFDQFDENQLQDDEEDQILRELNREKVCEFFQKQIEPKEHGLNLLFKYVEYCVYIWKDKSEFINNFLIQIYKDSLAQIEDSTSEAYKVLKEKLLKFLKNTNYYKINIALGKFDINTEERAILYGKLGEHEEALNIYVNILNDVVKAELYCKHVYMNPTYKNTKNVYYQLLKIYLNNESDDIRIKCSIDLLNEHSDKIANCHTLEMLPSDSIKCTKLTNFFEIMLKKLCKQQRYYQLLKHLTFQLNLQVHELRILKQQTKFVINEEKICVMCNKRLGRSAYVRYPDGKIIHYGCCKDPSL
jgi:hypothetical protein